MGDAREREPTKSRAWARRPRVEGTLALARGELAIGSSVQELNLTRSENERPILPARDRPCQARIARALQVPSPPIRQLSRCRPKLTTVAFQILSRHRDGRRHSGGER